MLPVKNKVVACLPACLAPLNLAMSYFYQPFSVLTEAKKEDEAKRATLYNFYKDTETCLNRLDDTVRSILEQNTGKLKDKIAWHKHNLEKKEYIVLVAGRL